MPDPVTVLFLTVTVVILPALAIRGQKLIAGVETLPRIPLYIETIVVQAILFGLSIAVCRNLGIEPLSFPLPGYRDWLAATLLLSVAVVSMSVTWRFSAPDHRRFLNLLVPRKRSEMILWTVLSLAAGFGEEMTYRAALPALLHSFGLPGVLGGVISAAIFGLAHAVQGWRNTVIIFLAGLVLHGLVMVTGTLWLAIAVHFLYDLAAGVILWQIAGEARTGKEPSEHATM